MRNQRGRFDRLKSGKAHDGTDNAFARGKEASLAVHHDPNEARAADHGVKGNIARDGALKRLHPVSLHNSATKRQQSMNAMGHANASAPDANPASPLSKEPSRKVFPTPQPSSVNVRAHGRTIRHWVKRSWRKR